MSNYDEYLEELKRVHSLSAKVCLQRLYELLKLEDPNMSKDDIYDRIVKDCLVIWARQTILNNMPDELKDSERQETGKKGAKKKQLLTVTNDGSVGTVSVPNNSSESPTESNSSSFKNGGDWESEKKQLYEANHNEHNTYTNDTNATRPTVTEIINLKDAEIEEQKLTIGKLQEQVQEHKAQLEELSKAVNAAAAMKPTQTNDVAPGGVLATTKPVTDSLEYKAILAQLHIVQERNTELEQLIKAEMKTNPNIGFQPASNIPREITTVTTTIPNEVEFPAKDLSTMFMDVRNAKGVQIMFLKIEGNKVVSWEADTKRGKRS
jgi:hypothetical protein